MSELQPHQQRVVDEQVELSGKLEKLLKFFDGSIYTSLPVAEQSRLGRQSLIMQLYEQVLEERISAFNAPRLQISSGYTPTHEEADAILDDLIHVAHGWTPKLSVKG